MLTISDIKSKKFEKSAFGYKPEDVENFLNDIIDLISTMEKEKAQADQKLLVLANKIEEYRNEEDSLRQALLGAQKLGDSILKEAKNRAEILMRDATIKSENIVKNVKDEVKREEVILNKMKREVDAFRSKVLTLYNAQVDLVKSLPEIEREKIEAAKQAVAEQVREEKADVVQEAPEVQENVQQDTPEADPDTTQEARELSVEPAALTDDQPEKAEGFQISSGFRFSRFDEESKKESKFGPLKFGDSYNLDDDNKKR